MRVLGGPELADVEPLAAVYAGAFAAPPCCEPDATGLRHRLPQHLGLAGFTIATAEHEGRTVGFCCGFTGRSGQAWTDQVATALGPDRAAPLLGGHLELVEPAVHPAAQARGTGGALLAALLAGRPEPRVLLQTHDGDTAAMRLSLRAGFRRIVPVPLGVVLGEELP